MAAGQWALDQRNFLTGQHSLWAALGGNTTPQPPTPQIESQAFPHGTTAGHQTSPDAPAIVHALHAQDKQPFGGPSITAFPLVASLFSIVNPISVEGFLREHKFLFQLLFSAFPRIKSFWGPETKVGLSLVEDAEGGFPVLAVEIHSDRPDSYEALDRFDEEWWLNHIRDANGLLNFLLSPR